LEIQDQPSFAAVVSGEVYSRVPVRDNYWYRYTATR